MSYCYGYDPTTRAPGEHSRGIVRRLRMRTLVALGVLAVATALLGRGFGWHDPVFMGGDIIVLAAILAVYRWVLPLVDRHDRGATGEEQVGGILEGLSRRGGWRVIHDANLGHGNVDHIAIGPAGVFTVETKSHPGPVRVGRVHGAILAQAQAERRLVEQVTGMPVEPLVVYSRAWVDRPLARRKGVRVVPAGMLVEHLEKQPSKLTPAEVSRAQRRLARALLEPGRRRGRG
ncbi:MAG TPA: nuclease-related domain-containing protein [Solirubrobacteraceae bacterium]